MFFYKLKAAWSWVVSKASATTFKLKPWTPLMVAFSSAAVASVTFVVAIVSSWATYQQSKTAEATYKYDTEYRELSIKPRLQVLVLQNDLSIKVVNAGGGTAIVTGVEFDFGDLHFKKVDGDYGDPDIIEFVHNSYDQMMSYLLADMAEPLASIAGDKTLALDTRFGLPPPGTYITVADGFYILHTQQRGLDKLFELGAEKLATLNAFTRTFARNTLGMKVRISYCSITMKNCQIASLNVRPPKI